MLERCNITAIVYPAHIHFRYICFPFVPERLYGDLCNCAKPGTQTRVPTECTLIKNQVLIQKINTLQCNRETLLAEHSECIKDIFPSCIMIMLLLILLLWWFEGKRKGCAHISISHARIYSPISSFVSICVATVAWTIHQTHAGEKCDNAQQTARRIPGPVSRRVDRGQILL